MMKQAIHSANPMVPVPFLIKKVERDLDDCFTMTLVSEEEHSGICFAPGQFNMLYVFGKGEVPISVSGDPARPELLVHTIREVGGITNALGQLKAGDTVGVRGPFGTAWPVEQAEGKDVIIMAGGLGIAPLRPAIYALLSGTIPTGKITLLYGTRSPSTILYPAEMEAWQERMEVLLTVDRATSEWQGRVGVVTDLLIDTRIDPENTIALVCGPEVMMRFSAYALLDRRISATDIFVSMERNMKCALGWCGRCQYGPHFICKDGPVFSFDRVEHLFKIRAI